MVSGFDNNVATSVDVLTRNIFSGDMYLMAQGVSQIVKPISLTIITIVFLIEFLKITIRMDILKYEYALRIIFTLMFAKVAIDISFDLLIAIYATASEWIVSTGSINSTLGASVGSALTIILMNMNWMEALALVSTMGISFFAIWISGMIIIVIAYARMFELLIYISISPLPCSFLPMENSRIPKKFVLSFASVCLQGLFIILSIKFYQVICVSTLIPLINASTALSDVAFNMLLGSLVLVMAVFKSSAWAKSILDVGI